MTPQQFEQLMIQNARKVEDYAMLSFPVMAGETVLRFIDNNFREQYWQGITWKPNQRGGTILVKTGALRRSFRMEATNGQVRIFSVSPYAAVHNRGFNGTVRIPAHTRGSYTQSRIGTGRFTKSGKERTRTVHTLTGITTVAEHTRHMNIPQRQFMPEHPSDSPQLMSDIRNKLITDLKNIF